MLLDLQNTIKSKVSTVGIGLHSGVDTVINFIPAEENTGIVFRRIDISNKLESEIRADYRLVSDTKLCTKITNQYGVSVSTIEHLMAALWGCAIDNIIIELDAEEIPIMDGSAEPFVKLLESAGIAKQSSPRINIEILKEITVTEGDAFLSVKPYDDFKITVEIDFENKVISKQSSVFHCDSSSFKDDLSRARTFGLIKDVEYLRSIGLAKGASLDNAIAVTDNEVLNSTGLRYDDEFARHKVLDSIGDLYLCGGFIKGLFHGKKSGHSLNNKLLRKIFATPGAFRISPMDQIVIINNNSRIQA